MLVCFVRSWHVPEDPGEVKDIGQGAVGAAAVFALWQPAGDGGMLAEGVEQALAGGIVGGEGHLWDVVGADDGGGAHETRFVGGVERVAAVFPWGQEGERATTQPPRH